MINDDDDDALLTPDLDGVLDFLLQVLDANATDVLSGVLRPGQADDQGGSGLGARVRHLNADAVLVRRVCGDHHGVHDQLGLAASVRCHALPKEDEAI